MLGRAEGDVDETANELFNGICMGWIDFGKIFAGVEGHGDWYLSSRENYFYDNRGRKLFSDRWVFVPFFHSFLFIS